MSRRVDKEEAAHLQYETEHTEPPKSRSVIVYLVILVAAAFLLLLLAYFMQQRTAQNVEGLHQSVNSILSIDIEQLLEDNRALQEEVGQLKEEKTGLEQELAETQAERDRAQSALADAQAANEAGQAKAKALGALHQLRVLYNGGKYKDAIALIEGYPNMERDLEVVSEALTEAERDVYDPLAAYQRIAKLLGAE